MSPRLSQLQLMQAASMIQNRHVMPREITPPDVRPSFLESPFLGGSPEPRTARAVAGASEGVMKAERTRGELG